MKNFILKLLAHPVWTGIGVIVATALGVISIPRMDVIGDIDETREKASSLNQEFVTIVKDGLVRLDQTEYLGNDFDYWPGGGARTAYDHLRSLISLKSLAALAPEPIFVGGPHSDDVLSLNSRFDFGRYNPKFLDWLAVHVNYVCQDGVFVKMTSPKFNKYLSNLFQTYWETYRSLQEHPIEKNMLLSEYRFLIESKQLPEGYYWNKHFYLVNYDNRPEFYEELLENGFDGSLISTSVYFWLRREMDGTSEKFYSILDTIWRAYNRGFVFRE